MPALTRHIDVTIPANAIESEEVKWLQGYRLVGVALRAGDATSPVTTVRGFAQNDLTPVIFTTIPANLAMNTFVPLGTDVFVQLDRFKLVVNATEPVVTTFRLYFLRVPSGI